MSDRDPTPDMPRQSSIGCSTLSIAVIALVISVAAFVQSWVAKMDPGFSCTYGGDSYLTLVGPGGKRVGHVLDDYHDGFILRRVDRERDRRVEVAVGDDGVSIVLYRHESAVARWSLTDEGASFEKLPNDHRP